MRIREIPANPELWLQVNVGHSAVGEEVKVTSEGSLLLGLVIFVCNVIFFCESQR
jgi:hypothetical protein